MMCFYNKLLSTNNSRRILQMNTLTIKDISKSKWRKSSTMSKSISHKWTYNKFKFTH